MSPAAVTYLIHRMVETEGEYDSLLAKFNVFVLPMVNPDGYEYSRQHDRMWRKTRSRTGGRNLFGDVSHENWLTIEIDMIFYQIGYYRSVRELISTEILVITGEDTEPATIPAKKLSEAPPPSPSPSPAPSGTSC